MSIKILLADDHKILREGLVALLEKQPDLEVLGEAADGRSAVRLAIEMVPDVVIMDINLPDLNGVEATRQIMKELPEVKVIALSVHANQHLVKGMLQAGARGYLLKNSSSRELIKAIHAVTEHQIHLSPEITGIVVEEYKASADGTPAIFSTLTPREREVLQMFAEGKNSREIADSLFLSLKTVGAHRRQIMNKLGVKTLAGLIKFALQEGAALTS